MSNYKDIIRKLRKEAIKILQTEVAKEGKDKLKDKTNELLYNSHKPKDYERSFQLRDSVSNESYLGSKVRIFFDTDKIEPEETDGWNKHMSQSGQDVSDKIPEYIERGHSGLYERKPVGMVEATKKEISDNRMVREVIKRELAKKGIKTK